MTYQQLDKAITFASIAHRGQVRKYTNLPYITHVMEVMEILHETAAVVSEDQLCAAILHDTVEDTSVTIHDIERSFGPSVAGLVFDLTDQFVLPEQGNRAERKRKERERLLSISPQAQDVKLADLISNTISIAEHDPSFARVYLAEKEAILGVMRDGDPALLHRCEVVLRAGQSKLVQRALQ